MNKKNTEAIIIKRTNFGEADRIMTLITSDSGKIRGIAKGVRKEKSKLAGGLELLSVSQIGYMDGRGELKQLVSSRLIKHYANIVTNYERVQLAYKAIEWVSAITEDHDNSDYFTYLKSVFEQLDNHDNNLDVVELWMRLHLLALNGSSPNLTHDIDGDKLSETGLYRFDPEDGCFRSSAGGDYNSDKIKVWRILTSNTPEVARRVKGIDQFVGNSNQQLKLFMQNTLHVS